MAVLNGGRLELGLRAGYIAPDYSPRAEAAALALVDRLAETVHISTLTCGGDRFDFDGFKVGPPPVVPGPRITRSEWRPTRPAWPPVGPAKWQRRGRVAPTARGTAPGPSLAPPCR